MNATASIACNVTSRRHVVPPVYTDPTAGRKWKICFVAPGHEIHTKRWVEAMQDQGHRVLLVTTRPSLTRRVPVFNPYEQMGRWRVPKLHHLMSYLMVQRAVRAFQPDLIHMHRLEVPPLMMRQAHHWKRFVISVWGGDVIWDSDQPEPRARVLRKKRLVSMAQEVTATTRFLAARTEPLLAAGQRISVVPWGVDTERFSPKPGRSESAAPVIGFAKQLLPKYGPEVLIESMVEVRKQCPTARAVMLGRGDPAPYLQLVRRLDLTDIVEIRGPVDHESIPEAMRSFDIFCMPSVYDSETFGVAAIEASACGLPVVSSRIGGVAEAVQDRVTGLLVKPRDPRALAEALVMLIRDPQLARRMGTAGRQFVIEHYRWDSSVAAMEAVYDRIMQQGVA